MGFFLTDMIQSALTPAGTNARRNQEEQQRAIGDQFADLFKQSVPLYQQQLDLAKQIQPQYGAALQQYIQSQTPQAIESDLARFNANAFQTAQNAAKQQEMMLRSQGAGDSAIQGVQQGAFNQAADAGIGAARQAYSTEERMRRVLAILQAMQQAQNPQGANLLGSLAQGVYSRPEVQVQQNGLGSMIGNLASLYTGGLASKLGKK